MKTNVAVREERNTARGLDGAGTLTRYLVPLGRAMFAAVYVVFTPADFTQQGVAFAAQQGVPLPGVLVSLAGLISLLAG